MCCTYGNGVCGCCAVTVARFTVFVVAALAVGDVGEFPDQGCNSSHADDDRSGAGGSCARHRFRRDETKVGTTHFSSPFDDGFCDGWKCSPPEDLPRWHFGRRGRVDFCDFPVFDAGHVPPEIWNNASWQHQPFVLRNRSGVTSADESISTSTIVRGSNFKRAAFLEMAELHSVEAEIGRSWQFPQNGGTGPQRVQLHHFVDKLMHEDRFVNGTRIERPYLFHRNSDAWRFLPRDALHVHPLIESWKKGAYDNPARYLLLGGAQSGVGFHRHKAAFQRLIHGFKLWLLYPPSSTPPGGSDWYEHIFDWLRVVYPSEQKAREEKKMKFDKEHAEGEWAQGKDQNTRGTALPLECIQRPGDTIYVPELWHHAVVNLADTLATSVQRTDRFADTDAGTYWFSDPSTVNVTATYEQIVKENPHDIDAKINLAGHAFQIGASKVALREMHGILERDPFNMQAMYIILVTLWKELWTETPGVRKKLQRSLRRFRPFVEQHPLSVMANVILAKHYFIEKDTAKFVEFMKRSAELEALGLKDSFSQPWQAELARNLTEDVRKIEESLSNSS